MTTRKELVAALQLRYSSAAFGDRIRILDEFVALTGYHRKHAIRLLHRVQHGLVRAGQHFTNHGESMLGRLDAQGTEVLLTLKPASYAHEQLDVPRRRRRIEALSRLRTLSLPNNDQRFRPLTSQRFVNEAIDAAIARVLAAGAARRPTSATAAAAGVARLPGQPLRDAGRPTFRSRPHSS